MIYHDSAILSSGSPSIAVSPYSSVAYSYAGGYIAQLASGSVGVPDDKVVLRGVSIQTRRERENMYLLL